MSEFDTSKDYYAVIGADETTTRSEIDRLYKRLAARRHPDKGGTEEEMKSLNEAYRVLKNEQIRREYDSERTRATKPSFVPVSAPAAQHVGLMGHGLSAFFCLLIGMFLLFLVRVQWIWFLWPLAIFAVFVIGFGVLMARSYMRAMNASLSVGNRLRKHTRLQETLFWSAVVVVGYGVYRLMTTI
ncbi:MAG TPA: DnaJ domain-containing protein [Pyrinomonadaceae bacterium]|nr:DnaJ domain-containing protein [Pyrinomonadaceae bacterium]